MTKLRLEAVECFERDVRLRLPFRFGVITVTRATQAVIRATVVLEDGRTSRGVAAETLEPNGSTRVQPSATHKTLTSCARP